MSSSGDHADLIRKIRALLATAESLAATGHEEAAGAYIAKAHALQQRHSIDAALLEGAGGARTAVATRTWVMAGAYGRRKVTLAHVVCRRTGCTGYFQSGTQHDDGRYRFVAFGYPGDLEWAETLTFSLCAQADAALRHASGDRASYEHGRSFATSFLAGFATVVDARLETAAEEARAEAETSGGGAGVALVLAEKSSRVEAELRARVGRLRTSRASGGCSASGYDHGRAAGRRAHLARGSVGADNAGRLGR